MKKQIFYIGIFIFLQASLLAQEERKYIRDGYKSYMKGDYSNAEVDFKKAEEANEDSYVAKYNSSTAIYEQNRLEESGKRFSELLSETDDLNEQAKLLHNLGNVHLKNQKYQEAADAYKKSLRINPSDEDTRYNLAYALEKLREQQQQQQQQQQNQDQQKNQDQKDNKNNQDQQQQQNQQDQEKQDQEQQQNQQQEQDKKEGEAEQAQPQKMELSKEDAERLLQAILQKEKDVKEKVDKKKATGKKIKTDKDW